MRLIRYTPGHTRKSYRRRGDSVFYRVRNLVDLATGFIRVFTDLYGLRRFVIKSSITDETNTACRWLRRNRVADVYSVWRDERPQKLE
jgi:hypothetical protein